MRPDPDTCRDPDLLAAEVRRLQSVIEHGDGDPRDARPAAWAVQHRGSIVYVAMRDEDAQEWSGGGPVDVVPLYRSPTLTDAEREAVGTFAATAWTGLRWSDVEKHAATLRGLLGRIG